MIAFETLLLGIVFGRVPIRVMVAPPVTAVEIRLDDEAIGALHGPPWTLDHDFGASPMPHRLVAVGLDASGHQLAQVSQWVNLGVQKTSVSVIIERDPGTDSPGFARVAWNSVLANPPLSVTASLDGAALEVPDSRRIQLPKTDPAMTHLLSVEVAFSETSHDRADVAFGGDVAASAETELTAVAVTVGRGAPRLDLGKLRGLFGVEGAPRDPVAVEIGRAEVALVFDGSAAWADAFRGRLIPRYLTSVPRLGPEADRFFALTTDIDTRRDAEGRDVNLYPRTPAMRIWWMNDLGALYGLTHLSDRAQPQRLVTAVAVAGASVASSGHRRAVVLMLAEGRAGAQRLEVPSAASGIAGGAQGSSGLSIPAVKAYLEALDVPLVVWSLTGPSPGPFTEAWGAAEDISTTGGLRRANKKLQALLAAQRIVWFAGRHLPQKITLDESRTALRLAR